jgi:osmoprotectant transport system permease protein
MRFLLTNPQVVLRLLLEHIELTGLSLLIAALIALPLGWLLYNHRWLAGPVLGLLGVIYTIPSIALIIFFIPFFGLNARSVLVALVLYCQIILVRNVLAGLESIDPAILEAARGMGMNSWQITWRVQLPLALPVILAGMRIAGVVSLSIATIGAKFGAGGLGTLLFDGIAQAGRFDKIWLGGLLVGGLALLLNRSLLILERKYTPQLQIVSEY